MFPAGNRQAPNCRTARSCAYLVGVEKSKTVCGEFVVRASFTVAGRGTCVAGYAGSGTVRRDDEVRWLNDGRLRHARCSGVSSLTERPEKDPPSVGLILADAEPTDFVEGMTLTICR